MSKIINPISILHLDQESTQGKKKKTRLPLIIISEQILNVCIKTMQSKGSNYWGIQEPTHIFHGKVEALCLWTKSFKMHTL